MLQGYKLRHTGGRGNLWFQKVLVVLERNYTDTASRGQNVAVYMTSTLHDIGVCHVPDLYTHAQKNTILMREDWLKRKESEHVLCFESLPCPIKSMRNVPRTLNWTKGDWFVRRGRITSRQPLSTSLDLFTATVKKKQKIKTVWVLDQDYNG